MERVPQLVNAYQSIKWIDLVRIRIIPGMKEVNYMRMFQIFHDRCFSFHSVSLGCGHPAQVNRVPGNFLAGFCVVSKPNIFVGPVSQLFIKLISRCVRLDKGREKMLSAIREQVMGNGKMTLNAKWNRAQEMGRVCLAPAHRGQMDFLRPRGDVRDGAKPICVGSWLNCCCQETIDSSAIRRFSFFIFSSPRVSSRGTTPTWLALHGPTNSPECAQCANFI